MPTQATQLYNRITRAAEIHGECDDPDHEVGDLQDALEIVLAFLTPSQLTEAETQIGHRVYDGMDEWDVAAGYDPDEESGE